MIINTEDENDYYDEGGYGDEDGVDEARAKYEHEGKILEDSKEDDYGYDDEDGEEGDAQALAALQYYQRYKQFPPMGRIPVEAEYMSNPSDVIDEEEVEESEVDPTSPLKTQLKIQKLQALIGSEVEPAPS